MATPPAPSPPSESDGELLWLPGGSPSPGRVARLNLRNRADIRRLEESYPLEQMLPGDTIFECIKAAAAFNPDKPAIVQIVAPDDAKPARSISYRHLIEETTRAANLFHAVSADAPVCLATILPMIPEALMASWAGTAAGISTAINPYLEQDYVFSILNTIRATVLVTATGRFGSSRWDCVAEFYARVPSLKKVFVIGSDDPSLSYTAALQNCSATLGFTEQRDPSACATYQLTGGTTSAPKLCRLSHRGQLINAWLNGALQGTSADGAVGHAMPNFHIGGAVVIALRAILFSQTLVTLTPDGFRNPGVIDHFWSIARKYRLTAVLATPTTAAAILGNHSGDPSGHCITAFACGGSTVPLALSTAFHARFGIWLREQWGFSEAHGTVTGHFLDGCPPINGSIGYSFPFYKVRVVEVDERNRFIRDCAPGERGTLAVAGPIAPGYFDERLNSGLFIAGMGDSERWANSGDLGSIDANGFLWLFGRAKDVIVRGGHNIDPALIEDVLLYHPSVQLAAAVGRPDPEKGEIPVAYVQLRPGAIADPGDLQTYCREHVQERAAVPAEIILLETIPLTPVGKVFKPALRRDSLRRCTEEVMKRHGPDVDVISIIVDDTRLRPCVTVTVAKRCLESIAAAKAALDRYEFLTVFDHP